jgi:hypothetical protein
LNFLKTCKISYMRPLASADLEYESHDEEIQSFSPFSPQTGNFL